MIVFFEEVALKFLISPVLYTDRQISSSLSLSLSLRFFFFSNISPPHSELARDRSEKADMCSSPQFNDRLLVRCSALHLEHGIVSLIVGPA